MCAFSRLEEFTFTPMLSNDFDKFIINKKIDITSEVDYTYCFPNGYGASVIKKKDISYGWLYDLWELAVLRFYNDGTFDLVYDTPITNDVLGFLTDNEVESVLNNIFNLKRND